MMTCLIPSLGDVFVNYNLRCHSLERRMLCAINNIKVPERSDGKRILCNCSTDKKNSIILLANSTFLYFYVFLHINLFSLRFPSPKNWVFIKSSFITRTLYLLQYIVFMRIFSTSAALNLDFCSFPFISHSTCLFALILHSP
jgi:hypothetical protein